MARRYGVVAVDVTVSGEDRLFHYLIPEELEERLTPGTWVRAPFRNRLVTGLFLGSVSQPEIAQVKPIQAISDHLPPVRPELIELARWVSERYLCQLIQALRLLLPAAARRDQVRPKKVAVANLAITPAEARETAAGLRPRAPGRARILELLADSPEGVPRPELLSMAGVNADSLRALITRGLVRIIHREESRDPWTGNTAAGAPSLPMPPTAEQAEALTLIFQRLESPEPGSILLRGVTGSGKTEVYLQAIARTLEAGKEAIVLVPEISLTPQMISRFKARFGQAVAVLHSRLSDGERYDEWRRIQSGGATVVVGARSAVFAPFSRLGLIIIDEEHESTYKQEEVPRYHAREVAEERCRKEGALLILGSATPSLETYQRATRGLIELSTLTQRVDGSPLPPIELIDMREELAADNRSIFSRRLKEELLAATEAGEGAILFLNRRGFATFVLCRQCGYVVRCPNCDVAMAHHMELGGLCCHYCGHAVPLPRTCPKCGSRYIRGFGAGTERVEEELRRLFPHLRSLRMDVDTTRRKGSHAAILESFARGEADVLIGTQMIAKGLDIERVTLVGVISADTSLNLPDFRAAERTFQLVTQVAGRAGRGGKPGRVLVQTYTPDHYSIQAAKEHDYRRFFETEIQFRRALNYPPFSSLIHLVISGQKAAEVEQAIGEMGEALRSAGIPGEILGPSPAPLPRLKGRYRHHLVIKGTAIEPLVGSLRSFLVSFWSNRRRASDLRLSVDVNPVNIL